MEKYQHDFGMLNLQTDAERKEFWKMEELHGTAKKNNPKAHIISEIRPPDNHSGIYRIKCSCGFEYSYDDSD
jgi:hypothetical protein